jgi:hypothetical protein
VRRDLADLKKHGFNWVRVWATWAAFGEDVSAVDGEGKAREEFLKRLGRLVATCDEQGIVVDVTLSRGNGSTGPARIQTLEAHRRAVETLVTALKAHRNWYLDLANERNVKDKRFTSFADLKELSELVRKLDPQRLVTASHAGDVSRDDLTKYLQTVRVDFRVARAHGQVDWKLVPELGVHQSPVLRHERLGLHQVARRTRLEKRPGVVAIQLLDAVHISGRLHLFRLRHARRDRTHRGRRWF